MVLTKRWSRLATGLLAVVGAAVASGCSIPLDEQPRALEVEEQRDLIFGTTTTAIPSNEELAPYRLFFVIDDGFQSVSRQYTVQPNLSLLLDDLTKQPTEEEVAQFSGLGTGSLSSLVPANLNPSVSDGEDDESLPTAIVTVDGQAGLGEQLQTGDSEIALAIGQIVCTVIVNNTEIESVEIRAPNESGQFERLQLFDRELQIIEGPATAADFDDCRTVSEVRVEDGTTSSTTEQT